MPNSDAEVTCSSESFRQTEDDVDTLEPDVLMGVSAEDYFAGRDPVLEFALSAGEADVARFRETVAARQGEAGRANRARLDSWPQEPIVCDSDAILGAWEGSTVEGSREKPVIFWIVRGDDGEARGFIDSPAEEALGIRIERGEFKKGRLHFVISKVGLAFDGAIREHGTLEGVTRQEGRETEMVLRRKEG